MEKKKATRTRKSESRIEENFCRLTVTVKVEENECLKLRVRAKWVLVDWGSGIWDENLKHKFNEAGTYNLNIIGNRIMWLNIDEWKATFLHFDLCPFLTRLRCQGNKLQTLNLENCPALSFVDCSHNELHHVQVMNLRKLKEFKGNDNKLEVVDFSGCVELHDADLNNNDIFVIVTRDSKRLKSICLNHALLETKLYAEEAGDFPAVIINEGGLVTIKGERELVERGKSMIRALKEGNGM